MHKVSFVRQRLQTCGKATVLCRHKHKCYSVDFEVIDETVPNILGLQTCTEMNLIQQIDAIKNYTDLLESYSDVFEGLGCITDIVYDINVDQNTLPVVSLNSSSYPTTQTPTRACSYGRINVIQKVSEPTEWVNSMVTQMKICESA